MGACSIARAGDALMMEILGSNDTETETWKGAMSSNEGEPALQPALR